MYIFNQRGFILRIPKTENKQINLYHLSHLYDPLMVYFLITEKIYNMLLSMKRKKQRFMFLIQTQNKQVSWG